MAIVERKEKLILVKGQPTLVYEVKAKWPGVLVRNITIAKFCGSLQVSYCSAYRLMQSLRY